MPSWRVVVAAWLVWSVVRLDGGTLLSAPLVAFGASFSLLFGWYFLLTGMDWGFLYLLAGSMIGCTLLFPAAGVRPHNDDS